jgi:hypothetical protein
MGIKHCEYVDPNVINQSHCEVDFDSDNWTETEHKKIESKRSKTYAYV